MKKIITLMGSVLLVASSFAQYHHDDQKWNDNDRDRDVAYNDNRYDRDHDNRRDDRYNFGNRERDMQIAQINREYDRKIEMVKHKWFMSHSKKEAVIWSLEDQRRHEIREVYERFSRHNDRFDDRDSRRHW
jgi:hypothetical protein